MPEPKFKVAICGGGIGGLTLAALINHHSDNILVDIFEAKSEISDIGAAVSFWKRSWQIFKEIGLDDEFTKRNIPHPREGEVRGPVFRKSDQHNGGYDFHTHITTYGPVGVHRPVLLDILQTKLTKNSAIHTSKRLTSYETENTGSIVLSFADGSVAHADVLVGADGIRSATRTTLFNGLSMNVDPSEAAQYKKFIEPKWSGILAYRCFVQLDKFKEKYPEHQSLSKIKIWCGKNQHIVSHPYGGNLHLICFYSPENAEGTPFEGPWVVDVPKEEVIDCFKDWEPDVRSMLEFIVTPSRWAIHVVNHLPMSVSGRVALLGDAAHAMTTHQGQGACQAIEDAYILGRLLAHKCTNKINIADVLRIYQDIRLPFAQSVVDRSRDSGLMYEFNHPDYLFESDPSREKMEELGNAIGEKFQWLAQGGCDEDWDRAEGLLYKIVSDVKA